MTRYTWKHGVGFVDADGQRMPLPECTEISAPMVISDIPEYRSPIDGKLITSRSAQREDLKANDCVLAEPRRKPRGYRNPSFTRSRNLPLNYEG
jgi:hypothetical protein